MFFRKECRTIQENSVVLFKKKKIMSRTVLPTSKSGFLALINFPKEGFDSSNERFFFEWKNVLGSTKK
jgi:hypothetical protein